MLKILNVNQLSYKNYFSSSSSSKFPFKTLIFRNMIHSKILGDNLFLYLVNILPNIENILSPSAEDAG